jgi:hypothetical protein
MGRERGGYVHLDSGADVDRSSDTFAARRYGRRRGARRAIGQRTKAALAELRAQGVTLGQPRSIDEAIAVAVRPRGDGPTWRAIADRLDAEDVPAGRGGTWTGGERLPGIAGARLRHLTARTRQLRGVGYPVGDS